jgi:ATP-dependent DNA helicase DinG
VATDAFSVSISNRGVRALGSRALKKLSAPARLVHEMENESVQFFERLNEICLNIKTRVKQPLDGARSLIDALTNLRDWLNEQAFEHLLDVDMAREKAKLKANALISMINNYITCLNLVTDPDPNWVVWVEKGDGSGSRMQIVAAPLDVSSSISDLVLNQSGLQASVWMSATLASVGDDPFKYFKRAIGADNHVIQHRIPSPFDYQNQALLYLPKSLPEPNDPGFLNAAAEEIENILSISKGRAFILFTSRAALNAAYEMLSDRLPYQCRRQGDMSRQRLIEWFKNTPSAVLFGTASFWEGVSVDGDQLSAVIIDRIPFQAPDDPVYEARCDALKDDPEASWFNDLALPHATMRLKQGVGRLIRTHRDRGLVAVLDRRLTTKQYGARILECLPPMTIIRSLNGIDSLEDRFDYSGDSGLTRQSEIGEWSTR